MNLPIYLKAQEPVTQSSRIGLGAMPGLRSLVARRRSALISPQYSPGSKTPPPPSTPGAFYNAQKIERRCNSLPGQVSLDTSEADEDSKLMHPCASGSSLFNGINNGSLLDAKQSISSERNDDKASSSVGEINSSERGNSLVGADSSISNSSNSVKSKSAMEIESKLARRGVTVVRRMVDEDEGMKSIRKELITFPLKDSVITANPLITKENSKSNIGENVKEQISIPTSISSGFSSSTEDPKPGFGGAQDHRLPDASREYYEQPRVSDLYGKSDKNVSDGRTKSGQSHSNYEPSIPVSPHYPAPPANSDPSLNTNVQRYSSHTYYSQHVQQQQQQNVKDRAMQDSPSQPPEYPGVKESAVSNTYGALKTNSGEMSAPLGPSAYHGRSAAQCSPQSRSYQQASTPARVSQFPETPSPLSRSCEVSPQSKSADMSPYSRSSEASPTSRTAQMSPHSRSSQISPLSRSVKASPQSRSSEVSPQSRAQASPLARSDHSPKSRGVGLSPQSNSVDSPQPRSGHQSQNVQPLHQNHNHPGVNPSPLHSVGHPHISSSETHVAQNLPMTLPSQAISGSSLQQGSQSGRLTSSSGPSGFTTNQSEFHGRSVSDMYASCNSSEVLSSQPNAVGFPAQLNSGTFSMHPNAGSFLGQGGGGVSFPGPALGYSQEGTTSQYPSINASGGMVSNSNTMGFGNLSNCGGFPLHDISSLYGSHPNPGVYNIHSGANNIRCANSSEVLNYATPRDFSMHTPYRDFPPYSSSSHVSNQVRSQEISHNQREVLSNPSSRDTPLQNCNQIMPVHPSVRDSSLGSMGRETHVLQNYADQQLQLGYRVSSHYQRPSSEISSHSGNRNSSMCQNFRESSSAHYKASHLSNSYRDSAAIERMRNTTASSSYREHAVLTSPNDYQASDTRASNIHSGYREQSVLTGYRDSETLNNYLATQTPSLPPSFRESNSHSNNREQAASGYRDLVSQTSPTEQPIPLPSYQDIMNPVNSRSTIRPNYPEAVNHASPTETLSSRYRDAVSHTSPGEQLQGYGECVSHGSNRDMLPGFQEMQSPTTSGDQEISSFRDNVVHSSPRDQVMLGYQHSLTHTSPRHHPVPSHAIPVEQSIPSYQGNMDHSSPRDQQAYSLIQKDRTQGYQENNQTSPRQSLPNFADGVGHGSPNKALSGYRESIESSCPDQQALSRLKESTGYVNIRNSLDCCNSVESLKRDAHEFESGYDEPIGSTSSQEAVGTNNYGDLHGLQNFRVLSQHRPQGEFVETSGETKTAVLPSFTESFENASHNKLGINKSSYKDARDLSYYGDMRLCSTSVNCDKYSEDASYEKIIANSIGGGSRENLANDSVSGDVRSSTGCREACNDSCEKNLSGSNDGNPSNYSNEKVQEQFVSTKNLDDKVTADASCSGKPPRIGVDKDEVDDDDDGIEMECAPMNSEKLVAGHHNTRVGGKSHGASPEMISNQREQPYSSHSSQHEEENYKQGDFSSLRSTAGMSSDENLEKENEAESSGKSNLVASPSSQERIVIKMKLLHSKPDESSFLSGKYVGKNEVGSDRGNHVRYPMVKYTRWTIDSIINGREDGATEVLSPGTIKKEEDDNPDNHISQPESPRRTRKRRSSGSLTGSKVTKFDTNKNLMKKPLKITITNPLRARVSTVETADTKSLIVKCEDVNSAMKREQDPYIGSSDMVNFSEPKSEVISLRNIRKYQKYASAPNNESHLSSSSASRATRASRKQANMNRVTSEDLALISSTSSEGFGCSIPKIKKCSIVIKRIYTEDNFSCYSSRLCDKNQKPNVKVAGNSVFGSVVEEKRPKRKAAIEANERRHKSLRSFDRSLELFNNVNSDKVPYNGPIGSKYRSLLPVLTPPLPLINNSLVAAEKQNVVPQSPSVAEKQNVVPQSPLVAEKQNQYPQCSVLLCDIFMNRRINKMSCPGCSRHYDSSDSVQVNLKKMEMSLICCQCHWEVIKHIKPREVEAMEPR
ncbi:serine-rich adhesin for platelets-like [Palaemon carinicauda]|uniref:serine-rich adhesin for platelets-like n=1 Tax=Palaemon carinicauda TaxID=392227 RepID=UPI0035B5812B